MRLKNKLKSQKGAMDKVLVTLLLAIVAVIGVIGIEEWSSGKKDDLLSTSNSVIINATNQ